MSEQLRKNDNQGTDVSARAQGPFTLLTPTTEAAREWLLDHLSVEGLDEVQALVWKDGRAVMTAMQADGLRVRTQ